MQTPFRNFKQQSNFNRSQQADALFALKERSQILTAANRQRMILKFNEDSLIANLRNRR
jgi:hypothetical protein